MDKRATTFNLFDSEQILKVGENMGKVLCEAMGTQWHHVAVTYDHFLLWTITRIYVDGKLTNRKVSWRYVSVRDAWRALRKRGAR